MAAVDRWRQALEGWAIPDEIRRAAPEDPWRLGVAAFAARADRAAGEDTPSRRRALEALPPDGGHVLDVGCGAGAAGLALVPPVTRLTGVDTRRDMLDAYAARAIERGVALEPIEGRWPDVADQAPVADVAVAHHVAYNVADLDRFVAALTGHARARVVMELPHEHPLAWTAPYWREIHGLDRPSRPTVGDAVAVIQEAAAVAVGREDWATPFSLAAADRGEVVAFLRRHLCLPADRDDEVAALVERVGIPRQRPVATLWWDPPQR